MVDIGKVLDTYREDAVKFVREVLGVDPTPHQEAVLRSLTSEKSIVIKSGHGVGKTALLSWVVLWWLLTKPLSKVPITAPTMHQLKDIFWSELSYWYSRSELMQRLFERGATKLHPRSDKYKDTWFAVLVSARKPENMQGFHSRDLLFVVDEAFGISDEMFQVIDGALTNKGAKLIAVGNPTKTHGYMYDAFKSDEFLKFTFSSVDSPLVSKAWLERMEKLYGKESDVYKVRVLGEFPSEDADKVIPYGWIELAIQNENKIFGDRVMGVDIARSGNDLTAMVIVDGYVVEHIYTFRHLDVIETAQEILKLAKLHQVQKVKVEVAGVGAGVLDALLHDKSRDFELHQFIPHAVPHDTRQFKNAMAEAWWNLRLLFRPTADGYPLIKIPDDDRIIQQLSVRNFEIDDQGKIVLEQKIKLKKRLGVSPDIGDAMAIALYPHTTRARRMMHNMPRVLKRAVREWAELRRY